MRIRPMRVPSTSAPMTITPRLFPEIRYPPQRGRVHLDGALQGVFPRHSAPQLVPPDPGGLVAGEREQTLQFQGAAAPPGPGDALDGPKPEPQWLAGPFEDRARRRRRLPVAGAALETCALQTPALPAAAMRAAKAVRPAQLDQVIAAGGLGREAGCQLGRGVAVVRHPASMLADCAPPSQVTVYRAASVRLPRRRRGAACLDPKRPVSWLPSDARRFRPTSTRPWPRYRAPRAIPAAAFRECPRTACRFYAVSELTVTSVPRSCLANVHRLGVVRFRGITAASGSVTGETRQTWRGLPCYRQERRHRLRQSRYRCLGGSTRRPGPEAAASGQ